MPLSKEQAESIAAALVNAPHKSHASAQLSWWKRRFVYGTGAGAGIAIGALFAHVALPGSIGLRATFALVGFTVGILVAWRVMRAVA